MLLQGNRSCLLVYFCWAGLGWVSEFILVFAFYFSTRVRRWIRRARNPHQSMNQTLHKITRLYLFITILLNTAFAHFSTSYSIDDMKRIFLHLLFSRYPCYWNHNWTYFSYYFHFRLYLNYSLFETIIQHTGFQNPCLSERERSLQILTDPVIFPFLGGGSRRKL